MAGVGDAQLAALEEAEHQPVAVAADGVEGVGLGEGHEMAQEGQAVPPLLQKIAVQDQDVLRGEADLVHQGQKEGEVAVDVADGNDPPPRLEFGADNTGFLHSGDLLVFGLLSA